MKTRILILTLVTLIGCNQLQEKEQKQQIDNSQEKTVSDNASQNDNEFKFDNSIIPKRLVHYIETNLDSLRIPTENDYELKYFRPERFKGLPYFCSGNFNSDSLTDYAAVLIKDSTSHYVFSFHSQGDTYKAFIINDRCSFSSNRNSTRKYAVFAIRTETERVLESVDTVYTIATNGIQIDNIYESMSSTSIWNSGTGRYDDLLFD